MLIKWGIFFPFEVQRRTTLRTLYSGMDRSRTVLLSSIDSGINQRKATSSRTVFECLALKAGGRKCRQSASTGVTSRIPLKACIINVSGAQESHRNGWSRRYQSKWIFECTFHRTGSSSWIPCFRRQYQYRICKIFHDLSLGSGTGIHLKCRWRHHSLRLDLKRR